MDSKTEENEKWEVIVREKVKKLLKRKYSFALPKFKIFLKDLANKGAYLKGWPNFSKLKNGSGLYHCHLLDGKKGYPTLIALWLIVKEDKKIVEVVDVKTHSEFDKCY